ncbi:MAG: hypothetical protein AB4911_13200 [Oscillochloridaceae bacterium umkhey_bin13]
MAAAKRNLSRTPARASLNQGWRLHGLVLLGYLLLALWQTWPIATHLTSHYFTSGNDIFYFPSSPDTPQNIWNFWMAERQVRTGASPLFTNLLYHPEGVQMILQTLNLVAVMLALPVTASLGPVAAYNLTALSAVVLTGYAGFWLARAFTPNLGAAFFAGALLTASPFHMAKLDSGQLNFVTMQWLVFFMLAFVWLTRTERHAGRAVLLAALAFAAVLYTDWYWTLSAVLFGALWALLSLIGAAQPRALWGRYLGFGLLAALSGLPLLLALRNLPSQAVSEAANPIWAFYTQGYAADAFGLFFPAALHPWWAVPVEQFLISVAPYSISEGSYTAAGWVLAGLALFGASWSWRQHWRLLLVGTVAWLLALGPSLYVLGFATGLPMPYRLLQLVPLLETARRPNLFGVVTIIIAAIFAALALTRLAQQLAPRSYRLLLATLVGLAIFELWPSARVATALEAAPVFAQIATDPGVVVDLPLEAGTDSRPLINQMVHGQPIIRGYVARPPAYPTLAYSPLPHQLGLMTRWPENDVLALDAAALATMQCYYQLRYVVLDLNLTTPAQQATVIDILQQLGVDPAQPWYDEGSQRAYQVPLHADQCAPFGYLGRGWHAREQQAERVWRWSEARSDLFLINPDPTPRLIKLHLQLEAREADQPVELWQDDQLLARWYLPAGTRTYQLALWLEPGQQRLELRTPVVRENAGWRDLGVVLHQLVVR